jgi:hypothetical protein
MEMIKQLIDKYEARREFLWDEMYDQIKTDLHSTEYEIMRAEWLTINKLLPELYSVYHIAKNQKPFEEFASDFLEVMLMYRENAEIIHEKNLGYLQGYLHGIDDGIGRFNSISKYCEGKRIM